MIGVAKIVVEIHFTEEIDEHGDEAMQDADIPMRSLAGQVIGTTKVRAIEHPEPHVVRLDLALDDVVFADGEG